MTFQSVLESVDSHKVNQYKEYWNNVAPQTDGEFFQRWLFAYTSIHTTWESNVRAYNHIKISSRGLIAKINSLIYYY